MTTTIAPETLPDCLQQLIMGQMLRQEMKMARPDTCPDCGQLFKRPPGRPSKLTPEEKRIRDETPKRPQGRPKGCLDTKPRKPYTKRNSSAKI